MGVTYFKGAYSVEGQEMLVMVPARSATCAADCRRIGLLPIDETEPFEDWVERRGYLAPGLCYWFEKPDPAAVERRRQEQAKEKKRLEQVEQHRQQQEGDHAAISARDLELTAAHDAVQQRVQQRMEQVDQRQMGIRQELNASLAKTADCRDLTEERDDVAQRHTERLALMAQQAAQLDADRQRQQEERADTEEDAVFQQAQEAVAQALSTHQPSLDALAAAMAEHREAEHQRRVNDALAEEFERLELENTEIQVGMHA